MSVRAVRAVLERSKAKGTPRLLLVVLAEHLNEQSRRCDPSVATLARECNASPRTIPRLLGELKESGEIEVHTGGGRNRCNHYTITAAENGTGGIIAANENPDSLVSVSHENPDSLVSVSHENPDIRVTVSGKETLTPVTGFEAETLTNQVKNPDIRVRQTRKNHNDISEKQSGFAEFWKTYPRKVNKPAALRAWCKTAQHRPPLADILAAITAHKRQWTDAKFIPHPASWLNGQRWADEIETTAPNTRRDGGASHLL